MSGWTLARLLDGLAIVPGGGHIAVGGLSLDSRMLRPGEVFVALAGDRGHGLAHAARALDAGAAAVLFEPPQPSDIELPGNCFAVPGLRAALGTLAARFHGDPSRSLDVIGITGTNGKTSTVQLLAQALHAEGCVAGSIGTLGAGLHGQVEAGERTTPDVLTVHALLARMQAAGATHVAMEVSSHALDQGRVDGVVFRVAAFTNLSRDHLDYHGDMASYAAAKTRLFHTPGLAAAVLNLDDACGREIHAGLPQALARIGFSAHGREGAVLAAENISLRGNGLRFDLVEGGERAEVESPLLGRFNVDNLLAVAGVLRALGRSVSQAGALLARLQPVPGRMTTLGGDAGQPLVVVDYAHTPDALEQALAALRDHLDGVLVCVFGCGGERDRGKRAQMAAIAERLADRVIVTDDNPRNEDGDRIVEDILAGFREPARAQVERDRGRAIARAIAGAGNGDIVLLAGKGHEPYQEVGSVRHRFDDARVARAALEGRA